jgi:hypothetical protein
VNSVGRLKKYARHHVGPLRSVRVVGGAVGDWYLLSYGPVEGSPDFGYFDAQGLTRRGNRISMVSLRLVGQDYNYSAGEEPMVVGVRNAAARLG